MQLGADPVAVNDLDETPLSGAATHNDNVEVLKVLIEAGADINRVGISGNNPLMLAARFSHNPEVVEFLLDNGADPNLRNNVGKVLNERASDGGFTLAWAQTPANVVPRPPGPNRVVTALKPQTPNSIQGRPTSPGCAPLHGVCRDRCGRTPTAEAMLSDRE